MASLNPKRLAVDILQTEELARRIAKLLLPPPEIEKEIVPPEEEIEEDPSWLLPPTPLPRAVPSPRARRIIPIPPAPPLVPEERVYYEPPVELKEFTYHVRKTNHPLDGRFVVMDFDGEGEMKELSLRANNGNFRVEVRVDDFDAIYDDDFDAFLTDSPSIGSIFADVRPSDETDYPYWLALAPVKFASRIYVVITTYGAVMFERIFLKADVKIFG